MEPAFQERLMRWPKSGVVGDWRNIFDMRSEMLEFNSVLALGLVERFLELQTIIDELAYRSPRLFNINALK
jgi:hypothetical protein